MLKRSKVFLALFLVLLPSVLFAADSSIRLNSLGFLPQKIKRVTISEPCSHFEVVDADAGKTVYKGRASGPMFNRDTEEHLFIADFTLFKGTGTFYLSVPGVGKSCVFKISDGIYNHPYCTVMRGYYLWRCGTAVKADFNGVEFLHKACHLDDGYLDYISGKHRKKDGTGGWHDAGDYGKYTVNSAFSLSTLFKAWEHFGDVLKRIQLDIPGSGGKLPDFLAELKWELDWLLKMQFEDGSVSHKLTSLKFCGMVMPEDDKDMRYFVPWGSAATADFAAVMAEASRIYRPYDEDFADTCLDAALLSYSFLKEHPDYHPADQHGFETGPYECDDSAGRLRAAVELWETTGSNSYLNDFESLARKENDIISFYWDWYNSKEPGMFTYVLSQRKGKDPVLEEDIRSKIISQADTIVSTVNAHGYGRPLGEKYHWGSNGTIARQTMTLRAAFFVTGDPKYVDACTEALGYIFGRNYYCRSQVTGIGLNPPSNAFNRVAVADNTADTWPGYLVGGGVLTGTDWVDEDDNYMKNEIAINWNAALVYALAGFVTCQDFVRQ